MKPSTLRAYRSNSAWPEREKFRRVLAGEPVPNMNAPTDYAVEVYFALEDRWLTLRRAGKESCERCFERTTSQNLASSIHVRPTETMIRLIELRTGRVVRSAKFFERPR